VNGALVLFATMTVAVTIGCGILIAVLSRRLAPLRLARQRAIAALCTQRGLLPGALSSDFAMLGLIPHQWLSNSFTSPDQGVAAADFIRPAGKTTQFFSLLAFIVAGLNVPYVAVTRRSLGTITIGGPPAVELESIDFDQRFTIRAKDRRSAVMLLDPGMMQLLLDCEPVNFFMSGDKVLAFVNREAEPKHQPTEPIEFEQLFRFLDGFLARAPDLLRTEYPAAP
jgi:hypothetical protein